MLVGAGSSNTRVYALTVLVADIFISYTLSPSFLDHIDYLTTTQQNMYYRCK